MDPVRTEDGVIPRSPAALSPPCLQHTLCVRELHTHTPLLYSSRWRRGRWRRGGGKGGGGEEERRLGEETEGRNDLWEERRERRGERSGRGRGERGKRRGRRNGDGKIKWKEGEGDEGKVEEEVGVI